MLTLKPELKPQPKVAAAGKAGFAATLLVSAAALADIELPPEVAAAFVTLATFGAAYRKRDKPKVA